MPDWIWHEALDKARTPCKNEIHAINSRELKNISGDPFRKLKDDELEEIIQTTYAR
jgi:hypothetical protein